ncbi:MAG: hypothetical protein CMM94_03560 [Rickettsiales bacterium]|nr:hypothetical protein [Rickettsiales bacterium]
MNTPQSIDKQAQVATALAASEEERFFLTRSDVERLLEDDSADSRITILDKVSHHYDHGNFQPQEFLLAEQIFRTLMKDTELRVRETLSARLKDNPNIPRDVILHMANDVEQVAVPVLESSQVLSDADLITIIETSRDIGKLQAVTQRDRVSERVSDALVDTNYPQVVRSLLLNEFAKVSRQGYDKILKEFSSDTAIKEAVAERPSLPPALAEKLVSMVSDSLSKKLQEKYNLSAETLAEEAQSSREENVLAIAQNTKDPAELASMIEQMVAANRLSPSIIMTSLCRGNLAFFETSLAKMAHIPVENAKRLLADKGELGYQGLYSKTGLPGSMYEAIKIVLHVVQDMHNEGKEHGDGHFTNEMVERVLATAGNREVENLSYIIALIRQA